MAPGLLLDDVLGQVRVLCFDGHVCDDRHVKHPLRKVYNWVVLSKRLESNGPAHRHNVRPMTQRLSGAQVH